MRQVLFHVLMVTMLAGPGWAADAITLDDARIKALADTDAKAQRAAIQQLVEAGPAAIPALAAVMDRGGPADLKPALQALLGITSGRYTEDQRKEVSSRFVAELDGKHAVPTRREICRLLGFVGGSECVDPLYKLLMDPDLRETVRQTLVRIPSREATQALVAGLQITEGEFLAALVDAIGERRDPAALPVLRAMAIGPDSPLSRSGMAALSRIPSPEAVQTLVPLTEADKPGALAALLRMGETLVDADREEDALTAFHAAGKRPSITAAEYTRVLSGIARFGEPADLQTLLSAARESAKWGPQAAHVHGAAMWGLAGAPGQKATDFMAEAMAKEPGALKMDLLAVLGKRGPSMSPAGVEALVKAASADADPSVRLLAIRAIGAARVEGAIAPLLVALRAPAGPLRDAAEQSICSLSGPAITTALVGELDKKDLPVDLRARMVLLLANSTLPAAFDALLKASNESDVSVRAAAFQAMRRLGSEKAFDRLLDAVGGAAGPDRDAAEQALIALSGESTNAQMRAEYEKANVARKAALLRILARRNAPDIGALLMKEAQNESAEIRAGVAAGLARTGDPQHESILMQLAEKGLADVTRAAVTGLLEIASKQEKESPSKAAERYTKLYGMALTPEQSNAALEGLSRTAGPEDLGMLEVVYPLLGELEVPPEVCHAAARLGMQLPETRRPEAMEILESAARILEKDPMKPGIVEFLWKLGSKFDPGYEAGFITKWWLAGPFKLHGQKAWNECHFPDARPDTQAKASIEGREYEWKSVRTAEDNGVVPLARILGSGDGQGAYAYTEITVDATQQVRFLVGSDDGVVVWLNGKRVLAVLEDRALTVDQDHVDLDLAAGVNRILVKSLNTFGGWEFCFRVTDPTGHPLFFRQRGE